MNIPDLEDIVHALEDIREACGDCSCDDEEPGYHPPECGSTIEVRLQVTEDDWEVHHGDPGYDLDHEGHWGSTTIASTDDDSLLEQAAEQLVMQVEESLAEDEVWI